MRSTKAEALDAWAERARPRLRPLRLCGPRRVRRRLRGRARSRAGSRTRSPCSTVSRRSGPILVGSSMGGWIALLAARELLAGRPRAGARRPRPDRAGGRFHRAADVGPSSRRRSGRPILRRRASIDAPSRLFGRALPDHPGADRGRAAPPPARRRRSPPAARSISCRACRTRTCPGATRMRLVEHLPGDDVSLTLIKDGDHRLSRPEDLERLVAAIEGIGGPRRRDRALSFRGAAGETGMTVEMPAPHSLHPPPSS